ncbi:MAG: pantetheine-phosphate adenylyltransferase [Clostridia bacterium]|nr:pantetheine-phosphate adenylyltransferase [Clostridia bacterium]
MRIAICPGSFDPVTLGHLDIISRSARLFDKVYVAVLKNSSKKNSMFTIEERMELIRRCITDLPNVEVITFEGLLVECAKENNAIAIVKGLRAVTDFEYEFQMALINKKLNREIETLFLTTNAKYLYLSSSIVKEVAKNGGDITDFVHPAVAEDINNRIKKEIKG